MTAKEFNDNELLFNELYEKTKDCGRVQFINLLMEKEREIKELKEQLETVRKKYKFEAKTRDKVYKMLRRKDSQQKEFIEYLESEIKYWEEQEQQWIKLGFMKFGGEANNKIIFKKVLSKYKEIIGVKNE